MKRLNVGVLASGGGSNLQSIIDRARAGALDADVVVVISNNSGAGALDRARNAGIDAIHVSALTEGGADAADERIVEEFRRHRVDLVALAGYMKKVGPALIEAYRGRILNIHPALLPKFGGKGMYGMHVHTAVIAAGETGSGPTVHYVDDRYDHGNIIDQIRVPVYPDDTPESLQKRVLAMEHELYPRVIQNIAEEWGK